MRLPSVFVLFGVMATPPLFADEPRACIAGDLQQDSVICGMIRKEKSWRVRLEHDFAPENLRRTCRGYSPGGIYECFKKRSDEIMAKGPISTDAEVVLAKVGTRIMTSDYEYALRAQPNVAARMAYWILEQQLRHGLRLCGRSLVPLEQNLMMDAVRQQLARGVLRGSRWAVNNAKYVRGLAETPEYSRQLAEAVIRLSQKLETCTGVQEAHVTGLVDPPVF